MTPPIDFIRTLYGEPFPGFLVLWSKQTKLSRYYAAAEFDDLAQAIADHAPTQDLYLALGTQKERLLEEKRGAADTVRARVTVKDKRPWLKPGRGAITLVNEILNQRSETVCTVEVIALLATRAEGAAASS